MKNKGFGLVGVLIAIGVIVVLGGGYYYQQYQEKKLVIDGPFEGEAEQRALSRAQYPEASNRDWETDRHEALRPEFKYPSDILETPSVKDAYAQGIVQIIAPYIAEKVDYNNLKVGQIVKSGLNIMVTTSDLRDFPDTYSYPDASQSLDYYPVSIDGKIGYRPIAGGNGTRISIISVKINDNSHFDMDFNTKEAVSGYKAPIELKLIEDKDAALLFEQILSTIKFIE